ncbi:alpha/beta fold hydrolase [Haloimpatiens sp. FM7330]|uniref:alpha/beta fold hydrolase n=1 Tax=Haloimpatiens sp. FM7330 TaxID=3298610 RepID=UPI003628FA1B
MPGMGCNMYEWLDIIEIISQYSKVIVIHRNGVGNSELTVETSTTRKASKDLYCLLEKLDIKDKVILVGHSYGGLCAQHFAKLHPEKVEGVVLAESASVDAYKFNELDLPQSDKTQSDEAYMKLWTKYSKCTKEQLKREVKPTLLPKELKLPKEIQNELLDFYIRPKLYRTLISELNDLRNCWKYMNDIGTFPKVPLKILVRDPKYSINSMIKEDNIPKSEAEQIEELWQRLSNDLKDLSDKSELKIVENSGHLIHIDRSDVVAAAIKELICR